MRSRSLVFAAFALLATLAAARRLRSSYCSLAHGAILAERFVPPHAIASPVIAALRGDARKVTTSATSLASWSTTASAGA